MIVAAAAAAWSVHLVQIIPPFNGPDGGPNVSPVWWGTTYSRALADRVPRDCSSSTQHLWQHEPPTLCLTEEPRNRRRRCWCLGAPCRAVMSEPASDNNNNNNSSSSMWRQTYLYCVVIICVL